MVEKQLTSLEIKKLRQRFVSDYNLPIQVLHSPYFEERLDLFESEFEAKSEYDKLLALLTKDFPINEKRDIQNRNIDFIFYF